MLTEPQARLYEAALRELRARAATAPGLGDYVHALDAALDLFASGEKISQIEATLAVIERLERHA